MPRYCAVFTTFFEGKLTRPYENPVIACVLCLHPPFWERFRRQTPDTVCRIIKVISAAGTVSTSSLNLLRARKATFAECERLAKWSPYFGRGEIRPPRSGWNIFGTIYVNAMSSRCFARTRKRALPGTYPNPSEKVKNKGAQSRFA